MELTPLDIRNQTFHKKSLGGIDAEEVKAFLDTAATAFEQLSRTRTDLTERLKIAEERVNYYRQIEKTIQDAVITMQRTVDEVKASAEKEAELQIVEEEGLHGHVLPENGRHITRKQVRRYGIVLAFLELEVAGVDTDHESILPAAKVEQAETRSVTARRDGDDVLGTHGPPFYAALRYDRNRNHVGMGAGQIMNQPYTGRYQDAGYQGGPLFHGRNLLFLLLCLVVVGLHFGIIAHYGVLVDAQFGFAVDLD